MANKVKHVLVLAPGFPPESSIGVRRLESLVRHMTKYGWIPHVVRMDFNEQTAEDLDYSSGSDVLKYVVYKSTLPKIVLVKKLKSFSSILPQRAWIKKIKVFFRRLLEMCLRLRLSHQYFYHRFKNTDMKDFNPYLSIEQLQFIEEGELFVEKYLQKQPVDLILSSSPNLEGHILAFKIKNKFGIKWVADCRDDYAVCNPACVPLEKQLLPSADAIISVSNSMASAIGTRVNRKVEVIENGYETIVTESSSPNSLIAGSGYFNLVYTGTFSGYYRSNIINTDLTMRAISELIDLDQQNYKDIRILIYGEADEVIIPIFSKIYKKYPNLKDRLVACGRVEYAQSLRIQQEANMLILFSYLFLNHKDAVNNGTVSGKVYEYLSSLNPILCIPSDHNDLETLLTEANSGYVGDDIEKAKQFIHRNYENWVNGGAPIRSTSKEFIKRFTREALTERYVEFMNQVVDGTYETVHKNPLPRSK